MNKHAIPGINVSIFSFTGMSGMIIHVHIRNYNYWKTCRKITFVEIDSIAI